MNETGGKRKEGRDKRERQKDILPLPLLCRSPSSVKKENGGVRVRRKRGSVGLYSCRKLWYNE